MTSSGSSRDPAERPQYWAFISYSHHDEKFAKRLHRCLETYRVPKKLVGADTRFGQVPRRLFPVFRDREELPSSADLAASVKEALKRARSLIVICSPSAVGSRWVNEEILTYKRLGGEDRILAIIVNGEPNTSDGKSGSTAQAECFPPALRFKLDTDGKLCGERTDAIAADVRPGMDGWDNAKLKLVAGLTGLAFDALRQRDQIRHRRRRLFAVLVALALAAGGSGTWRWSERRSQDQLAKQRAFQEAEQHYEQGRRTLLDGDVLQAAVQLADASDLLGARAGLQVALGVAMRSLRGLEHILRGHTAEVSSLQIDPSGTWLVSVAGTAGARLWRLADGKLALQMEGDATHETFVPTIAFRSDGKWLAFSNGTEAHLLEIETGRKVLLQQGKEESPPRGLTFVGRGREIVGVVSLLGISERGQVTKLLAWNASDGRRTSEVPLPGSLDLLGLSADESQVLLAGDASAAVQPGINVDIPMTLLNVERISGAIHGRLTYTAHETLLFSPAGDRVLRERPPGAVDVLTTDSFKLVTTLEGHGVIPSRAQWSPSGRLIVTTNREASVSIWRPDGGPPITTITNVSGGSSVAIDPSDETIAVADSRGTIRLSRLSDGSHLGEIHDHVDAILFESPPIGECLGFSPNGKRLLFSGNSRSVKVWDWKAVLGPEREFAGHSRTVREVTFSDDGKNLLTSGDDDWALIWDLESGSPSAPLGGRRELFRIGRALFGLDGRQVLTAGDGASVRVWDGASGQEMRQLDFDNPLNEDVGEVAMDLSVAARRLVSVGGATGMGSLWDASSFDRLSSLKVNARNVRRVMFSKDGSLFVAFAKDGTVLVHDGKTGVERKVLAGEKEKDDELLAAALSRDGRRAAVSMRGGGVWVWDIEKGTRFFKATTGLPPQFDVVFDPAGNRLATAGADGRVVVWEVGSGGRILTLQEEKPPAEEEVVRTLGVGWMDIPDGALVPKGFLSVQFSPDGKVIAAGNDTGKVCVWDGMSGKQVLRLVGHLSGIYALAFNADGSRLASGDGNGIVRVWDVSGERRPGVELRRILERYGEPS